jgi:hypothetical protein
MRCVRGWFSEDRIRALIGDHQAGARDNSPKIWALLQLELWLRSYIDVRAAGPVALAIGERPTRHPSSEGPRRLAFR